jgi:hypothetical protein
VSENGSRLPWRSFSQEKALELCGAGMNVSISFSHWTLPRKKHMSYDSRTVYVTAILEEERLALLSGRGGANQWNPFGSIPCVASSEVMVWVVGPSVGEVRLVAFRRSLRA